MRIIETGCGNAHEAFIESRFTPGVNVVFSNDNNKGKTIIFQAMMYALGNDPIFPSGFDPKLYYFYTAIENNGETYLFLRKGNSIAVKHGDDVSVFTDTSELKYYVSSNIFPLPYIVKDNYQKLVDLSLFYQLFFVGQDRRDPSNIFNNGYYNKQDFTNMVFALAGCLTLPESMDKLKKLRVELNACKSQIDVLSRRLTFYREHPDIASLISQGAYRETAEKERQQIQTLNETISDLQKRQTRLINRKYKLENLHSELVSLNMHLKTGKIHCLDCGSENITFSNGDLSFELTNDLVRKNILKSISDSLLLYTTEASELSQQISEKQTELNEVIQSIPVPISNILIYTDTIRTYSEDEKRLSELRDKTEAIQAEIDLEQTNQDKNNQAQKNVKSQILDSMNGFYKLIDPDGQQVFKDLFATRSMTFSGSEEQEYYFSRTLAIFWLLKHSFPIIMDCFRKGELSSKKENLMIEEYRRTGVQVILSATLKDEEYSSGGKYYNMDGVNAINYEVNPNSHILQGAHCKQFMDIVDSFGVVMV